MPMPMPKRQTERGRLVCHRILEGAEQLFAERGFYWTSIRDIAGAVDMPTASLLHHFPTKERLYAAVLTRIADDLDSAMGAPIRGDDDDATKVRRMCERFLDWTERNPHYSNLLLRELLDNPARLDSASIFPLAPLVDQVSRFIADGRARGVFRSIDPVMFIVHLVGSASYFCAARPTFAHILERDDWDALTGAYRDDVVALMQRALLPQEG